MKRIVSVSIGSSKRDNFIETEILGERFSIERIGTDGSLKKAKEIIENMDGKVDAIGIGGINLYLWAGKKTYKIKEAMNLKKAASISPIVDGSYLKNTLERNIIYYLQEENIVDFNKKKVLITSAMDRFGMAESLQNCGASLTIGDLIFGLGIKIPIHKLETLSKVATVVAPIACSLPFKILYPTGNKQDLSKCDKFANFFNESEIITGDFHYIKRYMPLKMENKIIVTNTITKEDLIDLKNKGVKLLITTTPEFEGRSFGTNVMEAVIVTILKSRNKPINLESYKWILDELKLKPRMEYLNKKRKRV